MKHVHPIGGLSPGYAHQLGGSSPGVTVWGCNLRGVILRAPRVTARCFSRIRSFLSMPYKDTAAARLGLSPFLSPIATDCRTVHQTLYKNRFLCT